jgi:hypothetical protein
MNETNSGETQVVSGEPASRKVSEVPGERSYRAEWEHLENEDITDGDYLAKIKRRSLFKGAYAYSVQIGFAEAALPGTFRFMFKRESMDLTSTAIELTTDVAEVVAPLLKQAQARVLQLAQEDLAWRQNEAYMRDRHKADKGKSVTKVNGKTEKKRQKEQSAKRRDSDKSM